MRHILSEPSLDDWLVAVRVVTVKFNYYIQHRSVIRYRTSCKSNQRATSVWTPSTARTPKHDVRAHLCDKTRLRFRLCATPRVYLAGVQFPDQNPSPRREGTSPVDTITGARHQQQAMRRLMPLKYVFLLHSSTFSLLTILLAEKVTIDLGLGQTDPVSGIFWAFQFP